LKRQIPEIVFSVVDNIIKKQLFVDFGQQQKASGAQNDAVNFFVLKPAQTISDDNSGGDPSRGADYMERPVRFWPGHLPRGQLKKTFHFKFP